MNTIETGWQVRETEQGFTHVVPLGDLMEHLPSDCPCEPTDDEGVIVHNARDGREAYERGERKPS